ncbi:prickle-like protein 1 [Babylonia areolata]|uniref:prickle-like protein 1 n=1 Tax=Babylonia areolata TaxID=304850 RepID=UPI003FD01856
MESGSPGVIAGRLPGECWHPGCFSCCTCRQLLVDNIYFCREGRVYCGRHYADQLYPRCSACDELIFAREYTQAEGRSWHVHHFCCWQCDTPLAGQRYIAKDDNPYCMYCFEKLFSKVCSTCQRPITADAPGITHNALHWHACPHCFSCHSCARALLNQPFILKDGRLYCSKDCHYRLNGCSHTASIARQYAT